MTKSNPSVTGGRKSSGKQAIAKSRATPQQEINESETRYRSLFSANTNALFLIGGDGHFLDANLTAVNWYDTAWKNSRR
jgi:PAS domain-containing protein